MPTLLDIGADMNALAALLDELPEGELTPEAETALNNWFAEIEGDKEGKLDNYAAYITDLTLRASVRKAELHRLIKRVEADENLAKRLKSRLQFFMELTGQKKVETRRYRISVCANGGAQAIDVLVPAENLPARFQKTRIEPNMETIREAFKAGEEWPELRMKPRGFHLRIS